MKSYLNIDDKWIKVTSKNSSTKGFAAELKQCHRILDLAIMWKRINCAADYNLFIQKCKELPGHYANDALGFVTNFSLSGQMAENTFPILSHAHLPQLYWFDNNKPGLLLCFCGRANQLNIPLLVFHATYSQLFGGIAYFFMDNDQILRKVDSISTIMPFCDRLSFLGTSGGAHIPLVLKTKYPNSSVLSFSPAHYEDFNKYKLSKPAFDSNWANNTRVYYSSANSLDRYFANYFKTLTSDKVFSDVFIDISHIDKRHNTLSTLFQAKLLGNVMKDLRDYAL